MKMIIHGVVVATMTMMMQEAVPVQVVMDVVAPALALQKQAARETVHLHLLPKKQVLKQNRHQTSVAVIKANKLNDTCQ
jgi:hypothetical protein